MSASEEWLTAVVGLCCITSATSQSRAFCAIYPSSQRITMDSSYLPPSQLLFSTFSAAITLAHFLLPILKPQSADLQYLVSPASPAAAIVILGTYYSVAVLLWTSLQSYTSFFSTCPPTFCKTENEEERSNGAAWPAPTREETSHYLTFLGIAFAASLVIYLDILRVWYRAIIAAWSFSYQAPNPDIKLQIVPHIVFCQMAAATSVTVGIMSLLPGYAMGQLLSVGREAKVGFVEKMHQPLEKPWRKRKGE